MPWGAGAAPARKKKKSSEGHSAFGLIGNLAGDVRDAAVGIPTGVVSLVKDPIKSTKAIGGAMWQTYSPLFEGDVDEFAQGLYDHPLAPILDVASVVTLGAGGAARGASALSKAGAVSKTSKAGRLAEYSKGGRIKFQVGDEPALYKPTSKNPLQRKRQEMTSELLNRMEPHLPKMFSHESRYRRMADRDIAGRRAAMMTQIAAYVDAGRKLSGPQAAKYETEVLAHSYNQLRKFAFEHDIRKDIPDGYRVVREHTGSNSQTFFQRKSHIKFENEMTSFGRRYTLRPRKGKVDLTQAAKTQNGTKVLIVPRHQLSRFGLEARHSIKAVRTLYSTPTTIWKSIILGYRPAFLVNNFVGNHFMYMVGHGGAGAVRGYVDALRQVHSEKTVRRSIGKAEAELRNRDNWQQEFFKDQLSNTLADSTIGRVVQRSANKTFKGTLRQGLFGVTHAAADRMVRRAAINTLMRNDPKVQSAMKRGLDFDTAAREVLRRDRGGELRRMVSHQVMDTMGDYHSLTKAERAVREFIPFYTWDRHITRHMAKMVRDRPVVTDVGAKVGAHGTEETERILGEIPEFLKGAVPLSLLGLHVDHPSRKAILTTQGLNPYSTVPELVDAVRAGVTGGDDVGTESLATQVNPLIGNLVQRITGRSLLTGAPVEQSGLGGAVTGAYSDAVTNLPQWKLLETAIKGTPQPKANSHTGVQTPFMFEKDFTQQLSQFLGFPTKQMQPGRARALARREDDVKALY